MQATLTLAKKRAGCINRLILFLIGSDPTRSHDLAAGVKENVHQLICIAVDVFPILHFDYIGDNVPHIQLLTKTSEEVLCPNQEPTLIHVLVNGPGVVAHTDALWSITSLCSLYSFSGVKESWVRLVHESLPSIL